MTFHFTPCTNPNQRWQRTSMMNVYLFLFLIYYNLFFHFILSVLIKITFKTEVKIIQFYSALLSFNVQHSETRDSLPQVSKLIIESRCQKDYSKRFAFRQRNWRNEMPRWIDSRYDQERNFLFFISILLLIRKQNSDCFIAQQLFGPYEFSSTEMRLRGRSSRVRRQYFHWKARMCLSGGV